MIVENWVDKDMRMWIAGVLDGDGIKSESDVHSGKISQMNDREALETIHLLVGGKIKKIKSAGDEGGSDGHGGKTHYTKDFYLLSNGTDTRKHMPQGIAKYMLETDNRDRFYRGAVEIGDFEPQTSWFAGYFVAEGSVNVKNKHLQIKVKERRMLEYWLDEYGGNIIQEKSDGMWEWYNHVGNSRHIIEELLPFVTEAKAVKMREVLKNV